MFSTWYVGDIPEERNKENFHVYCKVLLLCLKKILSKRLIIII